MSTKKVLVAFDFDNTITTKDTLFDFVKFYYGSLKLYWGMFCLFPILMAYNLGFIENHKAKERFLAYFFKGVPEADFNEKCEDYLSRIYEICQADAMERIMWHKDQGHELVIVSASIRNWIEPWAKDMGFNQVLATELAVHEGKFAGRFASRNCHGQEKVNRLQEAYPNKKDYVIYAYGDSAGDRELLAYSDFPTKYKRR